MDIRNYFSPVNKKKSIPEPKKEKKRKYVIESDDEDPIPSHNKKKSIVVSDSDDDIFEIPTTTKSKTCKPSSKDVKVPSKNSSSTESKLSQKETPKLKKVSPNDFFGSNPVCQSRKTTQKRKVETPSTLQHDEDFEKTLQQLDEPKDSKKKKVEEAKPKPNENSPPNKIVNGNKGLAAKLADKMKGEKKKDTSHQASEHHLTDKELKKIKTPEKIAREKSVQSPDLFKSEVAENKAKSKPHKNTKSKLYEMDVTLNKTKEKTPKKSKDSPTKVKEEQTTHSADKKKSNDESSTPDIDEQKKQRALAYRKFLSRTGPKNPGGKPLPEGKPNCLANLTFVITGMLETIDRDETAELIKKYGGRVTGSISKLTSYLVIGDDPGQTKIKKAEQLGTKTLDEDELFKLIEMSKAVKDSSTDANHDKNGTPTQRKKSGLSKLEEFHREKNKKPEEQHGLSSPQIHKLAKEESSGASSPPSMGSPSSSKSLSQKTESLSSQELASRSTDDLMFVDKYKPTSVKNIIGQQGDQSNAKKLLNWLRNWSSNQNGTKKLVRPSPWAKDNTGAFFKAALLSGPPGVGKTTTAHLVSRELGFDVVEMNASDTRSKRTLHEEGTELLRNQSLSGFAGGNRGKSLSSNHVLLMDEVDGMAGNEDRGGVQELIGLIKGSKVPIICMCNDRNHPKIRSLANHCFDLRFQKPRLEQIKGAMMSVCFREGIKIRPEALDQMILGSNQDVRQVLHHLSMWSADQKILDTDTVKRDAQLAKKEFKIGPWDVCSKVFSESAHKSMSIHDRVSLFFHDYSIGPLFVQENYLKVSPHCAKGNRKKLLEQISKTAGVLADSDIIDRAIRMESAWSLLPTQAIMSSVCPGEYMAGHLSAQVEFPRWLGNNSRRNKFDRLTQELHTHMRLKISGSKQDIATDYSSRLRDCIVEPLAKQGSDGVRESVNAMIANDLVREDLDSILELSTWPGMKDKMASVESKVKAAFTRMLNKESHSTSFSSSVMKKSRATSDEYGHEEEEEEASEEEEEEEDIAKDSKIKVGKTSQKEISKGKGKGKGKQTKGTK